MPPAPVIILLALTIVTAPAAAVDRFVDASAPPDGDGLAWATAHAFLADALAAATPGDVVRIAQGSYAPDRSSAFPTGTGDRSASFLVPSSVALLGGYAGLSGPDPDARDPQAFVTRLDGNLGGGVAAFHVVRGDGWAEDTLLEGCTITGGAADGVGADALGGGVLLGAAAAGDLRGCVITGNSALQGGGVACRAGVTTRFVLVTVEANTATISGAGMQFVSCGAEMIECDLRNNTGAEGCLGGGLFVLGGAPTLTQCRVEDNTARHGGGLFAQDGAPRLTAVSVSGNTAREDGGGAYLQHAGVDASHLEDCVFEDNLAWNDGGGLCERSLGSGVTVLNTTFRLNVAVNDGGGMHATGAAAALFDGLAIEENVAGDFGGGLRWEDGVRDSVLRHTTFRANRAETGGGASLRDTAGSLVQVVLEENTAEAGAGLHAATASAHMTGCTVRRNVADTGGGGILLESSTLEIDSCVITENVAGNTGAGLHARGDSSLLRSCTFSGNETLFFGSGGGASCADGAGTSFAHCTFVENGANFGGAVAVNAKAAPTLEECMLLANVAISGGGVSVVDGGVTILGCTINGNHAIESTVSDGGGVAVRLGTASIIDSTIEHNVADTGGGGVGSTDSTLTLQRVRLVSNTAGDRGGGLLVDGGDASVRAVLFAANAARRLGGGAGSAGVDASFVNCVFSGNRAVGVTAPTDDECVEPGFGGGAGARTGNPRFVNCTFFGNAAECEGLGGGASLIFGAIENCILWGNSDVTGTGEDAQVHDLAGIATVNHSCVQGLDAMGGVGNIGADPQFVDALGADGMAGTDDDDLRLVAGSPCIDAADNTQVDPDVTTDVAGSDRFVDDPDTRDTGVVDARPPLDMGGHEFDPDARCPGDATGDGAVDVNDLLAILAAWGPCGTCAADVTGDGTVDVNDLLAVLADWGCARI